MIDYHNLSSMQLDALREVSNVGAAHAATALSQIINKTIMINVSRIEVIAFLDISKVVGGPEVETVVAQMRILGDIKGGILLALTKTDALSFANILKGRDSGVTLYLAELEQSALKEAGSILAAAYLKAIGDMLKMSLIPTTPNLSCDKMGTILNNVFSELSKRSEIAFCIETEFVESSNKIKGHFLLIPEAKSLELILKALGV